MKEIWVQLLCWEDPLEKEKAAYSSILTWGIPCAGIGIIKRGHDLTEWLSLLFFLPPSLGRDGPLVQNALKGSLLGPSFLPSGLRLNVPTSQRRFMTIPSKETPFIPQVSVSA